MSRMISRKIFAGAKLRRIRRDLGLTQTAMAETLGISASYLNLVERDQRPLSAQLILRLAEKFDLDLKSLASDNFGKMAAELEEVFADPLLSGVEPNRTEISDLASTSPSVGEAILTLYASYRQLAERVAVQYERDGSGANSEASDPALIIEECRNFCTDHRCYFHELEEAADALRELSVYAPDGSGLYHGLRTHLRSQHGISVEIRSSEMMGGHIRRYDSHSKQLYISELLHSPAQRFEIAAQIGLIEHSALIDQIIKRAGSYAKETHLSLRIILGDYFARCVMMPYQRFIHKAEKTRYDIQLLCQHFKVTFEQASQRLTTLQRPGSEGIRFFFIRVDRAGNISERLSGGGFHFARFGGACPRWNIHDVFRSSGRICTQIIQMPDQSTYFSIAKCVDGPQNGYFSADVEFAIGLGCDIKDASRLVYSDGHDLADPRAITPVGPNCRLCERLGCEYRAFAPLNHAVSYDENVRSATPFLFNGVGAR